MASRDKGRRKWGGFSQENTSAQLDKDRSMGMRGGGGGSRESQALYRPGSGPLRKSGRGLDDYDNENVSQENSRPSSVQQRLRQSLSNCRPNQGQAGQRLDSLTEKLNDLNVNCKSSPSNEQGLGQSGGEARRKSRKPAQQLYVPKKVKEALAEQDLTNRSPTRSWNRENSEDRLIHSNRSSQRRNRSRRDSHSGSRNRDGKRFQTGSRQGRNENEDRWRTESPLSNRNYGNRKEGLREVRQGSEPLSQTNHVNDYPRGRDTRSVEPLTYTEKFQGKPPSGRWAPMKLEYLPPRLQKKYLLDNGLPLPPPATTSEDGWNGSTITFQGTTSNSYPPATQHTQTVQNLPPSGPLPPQAGWSNTVPGGSRGRGRLRPDEIEQGSSSTFRSATPDQYSAPSSRSHTPSQEYMHRSYDRRGSNSTMYTSMESLSRADSSMMPPPPPMSTSTATTTSTSTSTSTSASTSTCTSVSGSASTTSSRPPDNYRNRQRSNSNSQQNLNSPPKTETSNNADTEERFDWNEEVELEAERISRSSSVLSLRENQNATGNLGSHESDRRRRKSRREKRHVTNRSTSRDRPPRISSRERQNNQQNRENDSYNNNQKISSGPSGSIGNNNRKYDRRQRSIAQRSRESSKDRNYRPRNFEELHRHRASERYLEENWRTGRKISACDSDDGRQTPGVVTAAAAAATSQPSSQTPGVLVLPDAGGQSPTGPQSTARQQIGGQHQHQQPRTLFDPNNPNKPIVVTSPSSRASLQRENETTSQGHSTVPVFQSLGGMNSSHYNFQGGQLDGVPPAYMTHDQFGNMRPSWYDPCSDSFRSAKNPYLLLDIERADLELQWILSSGGFTSNWDRLLYIRQFLQDSLRTLLETDIKFCQAENVEQHFWKILFYNMIELLRKGMPKESSEGRDHYRKIMLRIIDEGTVYLEGLLHLLESKYQFKLETFIASPVLPKGHGVLGLALVSAQKILLFLGDLARYREQANETTNYGKSRLWYLKAQQLNPKNGRPYNQLAVLAHYARRKLDAVYYYMRSLMASNPFQSARESLLALFDENRKKYESTERKRKEEREWKERARMKEKEGANNPGGGLRREIWIHPGGRRVRRTTTAASTTAAATDASRLSHSDLEELAQLSSVDVNKRFVTSYLHVHGKLITKIGMETFQEAGVQMLKEFRALLQHSPLPLPGTRLLQLLALNMFAIESTQLKDSQMEQGYRSELQDRALVVSLQMFSLILERSVSLLKAQLDSGEEPRMVVCEDMQVLLPAVKIWCDWMLCHSTVWNPPPSCTDYRVGPPGDAWSRLATLVNLLDNLSYPRSILIQAKDAEGREDDLELVRLPEDATLAGFTPLMSTPQDPCYADKNEDIEIAQVCLRITKILFFGQEFLCGLETPVLKLQKGETGITEYVSVVEASSASSPSSPPEQSDSELLVESYSEDDDEPSSTSHRRLPSRSDDVLDDFAGPVTAVEIRSLIERKEELERRQRKQDRHRQRVQAILQKSTVSVEIEVRPRQLVPDTNCFIDYLAQLQTIARATSGAQPLYTLMVPLVVLNELEGLARGADARDCPPASRAALDPEHVARVAENAKAALAFARSRNPAVRCLTTKGTVLASSMFTVEDDPDKDGLTRNDDRILATCLSLCKANGKDQLCAEEGQPRRLRREVVLLTEDRNLRVKALARDVPVREVPDFMQWAGLG